MLQAQVNYWNLVEQKRHNISVETQGFIDLGIKSRTLDETVRHNTVTEFETSRHNQVTEQETHRHNVSTENLGWASLGETQRHNLATEGISYATLTESNRHNLVTEKIGSFQAQETQRHNVASEKLGYANVALGYANVGLGYANLAEAQRSHMANENIGWANVNETFRSHIANEGIAATNAAASKSQAETAALNAQTRKEELALKSSVDWYNAETQRQNADTARYGYYNTVLDTWFDNWINGAQTVIKGFDTFSKFSK